MFIHAQYSRSVVYLDITNFAEFKFLEQSLSATTEPLALHLSFLLLLSLPPSCPPLCPYLSTGTGEPPQLARVHQRGTP